MEKRDSFGSKFGVLVAMAGSAVGLGNLWRFPYLVGENGGAIFIIIYLVFVFLIGLPLMINEFVIGRRSQANVFGAFKNLCKDKSSPWGKVGIISVLCSLTILSFYCVVGGWTIDYLFRSISLQFTADTNYEQMFAESSAHVFRPLISTCIFLFFTALVVVLGVKKGIEKYSKIMMPLLILMIIAISIRSMLLSGAKEGIDFLFKPDFSKLTGQTVMAALGQAFFSLSIGCGTIITYASYVKKEEHIINDSFYTVVADFSFALLAGLAIMPAVFAFNTSPSEGPGLVYITLPHIFAQIPAGGMLAIIFFFILLFAALTSSISLLEVVVAFLIEEFHLKRTSAVILSVAVSAGLGVLCSLSMGLLKEWTIAGFTIFDCLDKLSANILLPLGGLLFVLFAGWKIPKADYYDELSNSGTVHVKPWLMKSIRFIIKYVAPVVILVILIVGLLPKQ